MRLFNGGNPGFTVTTSFVATTDSITPVGNFMNPLPGVLLPLTGSSLGAAALVGSSVSGLKWDIPLPYSVQWNFGVQRELPWSIAVNLPYAGNRCVKLPINRNLNALNPIYYGAPGDSARVAELKGTVPKPFFGVITSGTLAASQIQRNQLLRAYPHSLGSALTSPPKATLFITVFR